MKNITDELINIKVIDLSLVNTTRLKSCKKTNYIVRYNSYTKIVHACNHRSMKNTYYFYRHENYKLLKPNDS